MARQDPVLEDRLLAIHRGVITRHKPNATVVRSALKHAQLSNYVSFKAASRGKIKSRIPQRWRSFRHPKDTQRVV